MARLFNWQPRYDQLDTIVRSTYDWECKLAAGQVRDGRATA